MFGSKPPKPAALVPVAWESSIGRIRANNTPHASRKIGAPWGVLVSGADEWAKAEHAGITGQSGQGVDP